MHDRSQVTERKVNVDFILQVWLKFNDNTVNEASWEELVKESFGGHSNTSAYSLVYIDASKPDLLFFDLKGAQTIGECYAAAVLLAGGEGSLCIIAGETREDQMEEGDLEALGTSIPEELAEFVNKDNEAFIQECDQWDKAQEDRKKQEALAMVKKQQHPETAAADSSNDIEVSASHFSSTGGCSSGAIFAFQCCTRTSKAGFF